MEETLRIQPPDGDVFEVRGVEHPRWTDGPGPCPDCDGREFRRFAATGGRCGVEEGGATRWSDYWDGRRLLQVRCLDCDRVLYQHPAWELLYGDRE